MSKYWLERTARHLQLALLSVVLTVLFFQLTAPPDFRHRFSMATAYVALILLGWAVSLGPLKLFRNRPNPVSFDLRRDVGIWSGILALVHTAVGLTVHLRGRMWMYFFSRLHPLTLQKTRFGLANTVGLVAALIFLGLLLISNDLSIRSLGLHRWKFWQRATYFAVALTVLHGWAYQSIEKRKIAWIAVFWSMGAVIAAMQLAGFRRRSRNRTQDLLTREKS